MEPARPRGPLTPAYRTAAALVLPLVGATTKPEWRGWEHLPASGGFVAAPNHLSYFDPFTVAHYLYRAGCVPYFLGKEEVFRIPVFGRLLHASGQVPVYRRSGRAADAYRAAVAGVEAGKCIVIYPEGTLTRDPDLWPMVGKTGAARVALTTRQPVIPIAHWGGQDILPTYSRRPHLLPRHTVRVAAGPAVDLADLYAHPLDGPTLREATSRIMARITGLLEEIRGMAGPAVPHDPRDWGEPETGNFKKRKR